ncbi:hypothetical protein SAY86_011625 [Trapa natans]|uniref:Uncharacterized protein n=1 Tax=Trapa natans TaxID=22666 RepID=A0AAN7LXC4_TRANT|nr:hypothetical protein SAY86_011625 [Trapa natans]
MQLILCPSILGQTVRRDGTVSLAYQGLSGLCGKIVQKFSRLAVVWCLLCLLMYLVNSAFLHFLCKCPSKTLAIISSPTMLDWEKILPLNFCFIGTPQPVLLGAACYTVQVSFIGLYLGCWSKLVNFCKDPWPILAKDMLSK